MIERWWPTVLHECDETTGFHGLQPRTKREVITKQNYRYLVSRSIIHGLAKQPSREAKNTTVAHNLQCIYGKTDILYTTNR
jgi:hypothetical protein